MRGLRESGVVATGRGGGQRSRFAEMFRRRLNSAGEQD